MKINKFEKTIEIFRNNNKMLRRIEAIKLGIPEYMIYEMYSNGILVREERGLYRLVDMEPMDNPDFIKISMLIPKAVICLTSALYFYNLTTQIPRAVWIALPSNIRMPHIEYPPIEVVRFLATPYSAGINEAFVDGIKVRIYNPEKTVTDCFKFRKKIGDDVAIEALKDYMHQPHPKINKLIEYARINRVEKLMRPYLETLA